MQLVVNTAPTTIHSTTNNIFHTRMSLLPSSLHLHPSLLVARSLAPPSLVRTALPVLFAAASSTSWSSDEPEDVSVSSPKNTIDTPLPFSQQPSEPSPSSTPTTNNSTAWDPTQNMTASSASLSRVDQVKQLFLLPRPRAILYMSLAMALHFGGYEFVRSGMLALFTSQEVGFATAGAFPLAMGLVSPFSVLLLVGYGRILERRGPRAALRETTAVSLGVFAVTSLGLNVLQGLLRTTASTATTTATTSSLQVASQALVAFGFIYQNAYAHLLYTQHWSFLSSVMTPEEGSVWFASIAGISSAMCTMTGTMVKPLVNSVGLIGMVGCNCLFLLISLICSDRAYQLSETHGFDPAVRKKQPTAETDKQSTAAATTTTPSSATASTTTTEVPQKVDDKPRPLLWKAKDLFQRVPTLGALFGEVLTFQSMSVILNIAMVTQLKNTMPSDTDRAAWTGRLFASVSGVSGVLQFLVIPLCLKLVEPRLVWKVMPIIPLVCSIFQSFQGSNPALSILALSFFAAKTMDYSIRGVVTEMVYQPLDFDSRYLGKEIIGVFGSRFGKSGVSLILSLLAYVFPNFGIYHLSKLSVIASFGWLCMTWWLSRLVPRKAEAQEAFLEQRRTAPSPSIADDDSAEAKKND